MSFWLVKVFFTILYHCENAGSFPRAALLVVLIVVWVNSSRDIKIRAETKPRKNPKKSNAKDIALRKSKEKLVVVDMF